MAAPCVAHTPFRGRTHPAHGPDAPISNVRWSPPPVQVWNALSQTRNDLLATQRALTTAARAERDRCARIAESFIPSGFSGTHGTARNDRARTIADAIRNEDMS